MIRLFFALPLFFAIPAVAHAETPCDDDPGLMRRALKDPALKPATEPDAVAHVTAGNLHYREGLRHAEIVDTQPKAGAAFERAIAEYILAREQSSAPAILFNVAQSYRAAGEYDKAIEQYRRFLDRGRPRAALRGVVECLISTMEAELAKRASSLPPRETAPTTTTSSERYEPAPERTEPSIPAGTVEAPRTAISVLPASAPAPWHTDRLGWGLAGAGIVATGAGLYLLHESADLTEQANNEPRDDVRPALRDKADSRQTWGTIVTATGGALVVVGVIKLARHSSTLTAPPPMASLRLVPGGISLEGRF